MTDFYIRKFNNTYGSHVTGLSAELKEIFINYYWPGNVRELQSVIEGAMSMDQNIKEIRFEHLPTYLANKIQKLQIPLQSKINFGSMTLNSILESTEKDVVKKAIATFDGNVTKAAKHLGLSRQNLHYRIRKHKL